MTPEQEQLLKDHNIEAVCLSPFELEETDLNSSQRFVIGTASGTIAESFLNQLQVNQELDYIFIRQKDYIISLINKKQYFKATACLELVSELWVANNYEYKLQELTLRLAYNDAKRRARKEGEQSD